MTNDEFLKGLKKLSKENVVISTNIDLMEFMPMNQRKLSRHLKWLEDNEYIKRVIGSVGHYGKQRVIHILK